MHTLALPVDHRKGFPLRVEARHVPQLCFPFLSSFFLLAFTWEETDMLVSLRNQLPYPKPGSGDRDTLPPVPSASSHPGAQISTLEFFTG